MTRSKKYKSGIGIFRDSDKKRVWTPLPVSLTEFGERGRLLTKVKKVCGEDRSSPQRLRTS